MKENVLITGATGFLGQALIDIIYGEVNITALARSEKNLLELERKYPDIITISGDISDPYICREAVFNQDKVYHFAAAKHVGKAELYPHQTINTNLFGSMYLMDYFQGHTFINISTDKAAQPSGVYGMSKYLMERLAAQYAVNKPATKFITVRYGNVMFSTGSVLCKWADLLHEGKEITVTDPEATRFFFTVNQAIDLIFEAELMATSPLPYVIDMKSMKIEDLLTAMEVVYGSASKINVIGLQPGENKHERIEVGGKYSNEVERYTVEELIEIINEINYRNILEH